jgi:hypothetical protein
MVKLGVTNNEGQPVVILGLSEKNLELLKKGKPMLIDLRPFRMDGQAVITYGKTEADITRELSKVFNIPGVDA